MKPRNRWTISYINQIKNHIIINGKISAIHSLKSEIKPIVCFSMDAITSYYKFSGLKQNKFIILSVLYLRTLKWISLISKCQHGCTSFGKICFLAFFQFLDAVLGYWPNSSIFIANNVSQSPTTFISLVLFSNSCFHF